MRLQTALFQAKNRLKVLVNKYVPSSLDQFFRAKKGEARKIRKLLDWSDSLKDKADSQCIRTVD
jgi:hypothetical protein